MEVPAGTPSGRRDHRDPLHDNLQGVRQMVRRRLTLSGILASVRHLAEQHHLDLSILHGDSSNTVAKKGGDGIGYSGHKHQKGEKVIAIVDSNGFVLAPLPVVAVNEA